MRVGLVYNLVLFCRKWADDGSSEEELEPSQHMGMYDKEMEEVKKRYFLMVYSIQSPYMDSCWSRRVAGVYIESPKFKTPNLNVNVYDTLKRWPLHYHCTLGDYFIICECSLSHLLQILLQERRLFPTQIGNIWWSACARYSINWLQGFFCAGQTAWNSLCSSSSSSYQLTSIFFEG